MIKIVTKELDWFLRLLEVIMDKKIYKLGKINKLIISPMVIMI
jgi:hypothetical protein